MSVFGNTLWVVLGGGIFLFFEYLIGGVLLCLTIIGIPFGLQCMKLSMLALLPFGKSVAARDSGGGFLAAVMNILWLLLGGIWIAITHVIFGLLAAVTIIGLPFAKQHGKLAAMSLTPFGRAAE